MQIPLARLIQQNLVSRLPQEALVEATYAVLLICFINDLDEVTLF